MNKFTPGEDFLRDQIGSFEYAYDGASWMKMEKALRRKGFNNFLKWASGIAVFTAAVVTTVVYLTQNTPAVDSITSAENGISQNRTTQQPADNGSYENTVSVIQNSENQATHTGNNNIVNQQNVTVTENGNTNSNSTSDTIKHCTQNSSTQEPSVSKKSPCPEFTLSETAGCPPFAVQFSPAVKCDSMIYSWDFGDGKISTEKSPVHTYQRAGKYNVRLMVKYFKGEEVKSKIVENAITVFASPRGKIDVMTDKNKVYLQSPATTNKCIWIANDTVSQGCTAERIIMKNGIHTIKLITTNTQGCSDTTVKKVEINQPLDVKMANAFTPGNDGLNEAFGPITANDNISLYHMEIVNSKGQAVYSKKAAEVGWDGTNQQNRQPCDPGIYYYKLKIWDKYGNFEQMNGQVTLK